MSILLKKDINFTAPSQPTYTKTVYHHYRLAGKKAQFYSKHLTREDSMKIRFRGTCIKHQSNLLQNSSAGVPFTSEKKTYPLTLDTWRTVDTSNTNVALIPRQETRKNMEHIKECNQLNRLLQAIPYQYSALSEVHHKTDTAKINGKSGLKLCIAARTKFNHMQGWSPWIYFEVLLIEVQWTNFTIGVFGPKHQHSEQQSAADGTVLKHTREWSQSHDYKQKTKKKSQRSSPLGPLCHAYLWSLITSMSGASPCTSLSTQSNSSSSTGGTLYLQAESPIIFKQNQRHNTTFCTVIKIKIHFWWFDRTEIGW